MTDLSKAAIDVLAERQRQVEVEGWTPEHDDAHNYGELASAGACYAFVGSLTDFQRKVYAYKNPPYLGPMVLHWEWDEKWWKPTTPRRDLVKAAALILAEIERLDRQEATRGQ